MAHFRCGAGIHSRWPIGGGGGGEGVLLRRPIMYYVYRRAMCNVCWSASLSDGAEVCLVSEGGTFALKHLPTWPLLRPYACHTLSTESGEVIVPTSRHFSADSDCGGPRRPIRSFAIRGRATLGCVPVCCGHCASIATLKILDACTPSPRTHPNWLSVLLPAL